MLYLKNDQLDFLISISKTNKIMCNTLSDSQMKIVRFLEDENLIDANREILSTRYDSETQNAIHNFGRIISVSISERGKAYLAESKHRKFYFWIPIVIDSILSVSAIIISIIALCG